MLAAPAAALVLLMTDRFCASLQKLDQAVEKPILLVQMHWTKFLTGLRCSHKPSQRRQLKKVQHP
eukprot:6171915-Pleurochrysis_carterae.AAC.3